MRRTIAGQVVVITGASSGVGRVMAGVFGRARARIRLLARDTEALAHAAQEVVAVGGQAIVLPADVAYSGAVEQAPAEVDA